jgi:hypothetical protein
MATAGSVWPDGKNLAIELTRIPNSRMFISKFIPTIQVPMHHIKAELVACTGAEGQAMATV